jgi:multisubunit Na+/H+ antiporter MnhC subunit
MTGSQLFVSIYLFEIINFKKLLLEIQLLKFVIQLHKIGVQISLSIFYKTYLKPNPNPPNPTQTQTQPQPQPLII